MNWGIAIATSWLAAAAAMDSCFSPQSCCPDPIPSCNPIIAPRWDKCYTVDFSGEFLYWFWSSSGLDFMVTGQGIPNGMANVVDVPEPGRNFFPDFQFDPGFRAAAAVHFGPGNLGYDVGLRYTWFFPHPKGEFLRDRDLRIRAVATNWAQEAQGGADIINRAAIDVSSHFNFWELVSGYTFALQQNLTVRPFAGLNCHYITGDLKVLYDFVDPVRGAEVVVQRSRYEGWGIGPEVGVDSTWSLNRNFSFFVSGMIALPLVKADISARQTLTGALVGELTTLNSRVKQTRIAISQECMAGPRWDMWFSKDRYHLMLQVAGEFVFCSGAYLQFLNSSANNAGVGGEIVGINASAMFEF